MALPISLSTFILGLGERIRETFGSPPHASDNPVNELTKLRF